MSHPGRVSRELVPSCGAWWGVYTAPLAGDGGDDHAALQRLERRAGRRMGLVHRFHDMSTSRAGTLVDAADVASGKGRLLFLAWASRTYDGTEYTWRQVADGELDATVIDPSARRVAAYGRPIFLDFDHEPESHHTDGTDADFVAAYRHIHDRFEALRATNVVWVWTVTGFEPHWGRYDALYPGDDVVDWVAWDAYNFYDCKHLPWKTFGQAVAPFYRWLSDHHANKPFMLGEYGTVADGRDPGTKVRWYDDVVAVLAGHPRIKAVAQFDQVPGGPGRKRCDVSLRPGAVFDAWARAGRHPYLDPHVP